MRFAAPRRSLATAFLRRVWPAALPPRPGVPSSSDASITPTSLRIGISLSPGRSNPLLNHWVSLRHSWRRHYHPRSRLDFARKPSMLRLLAFSAPRPLSSMASSSGATTDSRWRFPVQSRRHRSAPNQALNRTWNRAVRMTAVTFWNQPSQARPSPAALFHAG